MSQKAGWRSSLVNSRLALQASQGRPASDLREGPKISFLLQAVSRDASWIASILTDHFAFEAVLCGFGHRRRFADLHLDVLPRLSL